MWIPLALSVMAAGPDGGTVSPAVPAMHGGFEALTTLVWLTSPASPKGQDEALRAELKKLEAVPHVFDGARGQRDPGAAAIARLFAGAVQRTRARFEAGDRETLGHRVRALSGLCFACHTRERAGADFVDPEQRFSSLSLPPLERAQALAATRQFDAAIARYAEVLLLPTSSARELGAALDDVLVVLVRGKPDPDGLVRVLDEVARRSDLSEAFRAELAARRAAVVAWKGDAFAPATARAPALLSKAEALLNDGGEVAVLRAAAYASQVFSLKATVAQRQQAMSVLGHSAGRVRTPLLWDLDLLYFEGCVREAPKTPLARRCLAAFSERLTMGFSGSSGTHIPADEAARLEQLRGLVGP